MKVCPAQSGNDPEPGSWGMVSSCRWIVGVIVGSWAAAPSKAASVNLGGLCVQGFLRVLLWTN